MKHNNPNFLFFLCLALIVLKEKEIMNNLEDLIPYVNKNLK